VRWVADRRDESHNRPHWCDRSNDGVGRVTNVRFFCPIASGRTNTILPSDARRCRTRAQCDWALVGPLQSAGPHSAPLPTGTPPTLLVLIVWLRSVRLRPSVLRQVLLRGVSQGRCRLRRLPLGRTRLRLYALRSGALRLDRVQEFPSSLPLVPVRLGAVRARGQKKVAGVRPGDLGVTNSSSLPLSYNASYKFSLRCSCVSVLCAMVPMPFVRRGPHLL